MRNLLIVAVFAAAQLASSVSAKDIPDVLPRPDNKAPNTTKPVKVFFLSGQSNMCGMGRPDSLKPLATENEKFGYLLDEEGKWTVRNDVHHIYYVMDKRAIDAPLTVTVRFGPEVGIGHVVGYYHDEMVLLIKGACGNRSLGWDFMPPTSRKRLGQTKTDGWYAGTSYDRYVKHAKEVLANLKDNLPGYKGQGYELAGFFWWQGHKDKGMAQEKYERLLAEFIQDLRTEFKAPNAPFVLATVGFNGRNLGPWKGVFDAQMAISDPKRHPKFAGNVASVDIRDMGGGGYHYGNNGATYTKVGDAMGRAMAKLLAIKDSKNAANSKDAAAMAAVEKLVAEKEYLKAVTALRRLATAKRGTDLAKKAADRIKALRDDPKIGQAILDAEAAAFEKRCTTAEEKKDYALAIKLYEQYIKQFPGSSRLAEVKSHLESLKSDKTVQAAMTKTQAESDCRRWMSLADNYAKAGMKTKAREYLKKIIDKYGDTEWADEARVQLAKIQGR